MVKVCVIGVGAIGGYIGCSLIMKKIPVQLFVKKNHKLNNERCLQLHAPWQIGKVFFDDIVNDVSNIDADIVVICTKSTSK